MVSGLFTTLPEVAIAACEPSGEIELFILDNAFVEVEFFYNLNAADEPCGPPN